MLAVLTLAAQLAACPVQAAVLERAADRIEQSYVDAGHAGRIASAVRAWARDGRYADACDDPARFLDRLNHDLDTYDGHFHVEQVTQAASGDDWLMQWRADAPSTNAGVREVRVLEGNVGYIRLSTFYPWDLAGEKLRHAWALVADTSGLILDLRQNGGGDAMTPSQIVRSLLGPDVDAVQDIESRKGKAPDPLPEAALPFYAAPVVVVVDRRTGSASEFVAYALQASGRAKVVGGRTGGVAHLIGTPVPLGDGFQISIPDARPLNRQTGGNWEKTGVQPDLRGGDDPVFVARMYLAELVDAGLPKDAAARP